MAAGAAILALVNPQGAASPLALVASRLSPLTSGGLTGPGQVGSSNAQAIVPAQPATVPGQSSDSTATPGFAKASATSAGGFVTLRALGSILLLGCVLAWCMSLSGCGKTAPVGVLAYSPPAQCTGGYDNATGKYMGADSEILNILPNPTAVGVGLQLADVACIKSGAYKAADALSVVDDVEAAVDACESYGQLAAYITGKLADANTAAGAEVFVSSGLLGQFTSLKPLTDCDRAIIKRHLAAQRVVINALGGK